MNIALWILTLQGLLGGLDNLWHHEITERLPEKPEARGELALHAARELIYAVIFLGLAWWAWQGLWAAALLVLFLVEIVITLWDFLIEDRTRKLPGLERVLHTLLAINFGAFLAFFLPELLVWFRAPTAFAARDHGLFSWVLTAYGAGVFLWGLRDLRAVRRLAEGSTPPWRSLEATISPRAAPQSYLVTGGTGFIGRALCRRLIERGDRVTVLTRRRAKAERLFGPFAEIVTSLEEIPSEAVLDGIVNLAGAPLPGLPWTRRRRRTIRDSRLATTRDLIALIDRLETRPEVLVTGSAVGYYGPRDARPLSELDAPGADFMAGLCRDWEVLGRRAEGKGLRVVRLRIGLVLGRDGGILPAMALPLRLGLGFRIGRGTHWQSWILLDDLLRLILFTLSDPRARGAWNATAPGAVTHRAFMSALAAQLNRRFLVTLPARPLRLLMGAQSDLLLTGQRVLPQRAQRLGFRFQAPSLEEALARLYPKRLAKGALTVFYNDACPVCSAEMRQYDQLLLDDTALLPISDNLQAVAAEGLAPTTARRRLYAFDEEGRRYVGIEAIAALWDRLPGYRLAAGVLRWPPLFKLAGFFYEHLVSAVLWRWAERRLAHGLGKERAHAWQDTA